MESDRKIESCELKGKIKSDEIKNSEQVNGGQMIHENGKENVNPNKDNTEHNIRRHDEPSELSFETGKRAIKKYCCCFSSIDDFINIFVVICVCSTRKPGRKSQKTID